MTSTTAFSDPLARAVFDSLSAHIAILDAGGVILATNRAWRAYAAQSGLEENPDTVGMNYITVCDGAAGPEAEQARRAAAGIRSVIAEETDEFLFDYPCHSPEEKHWYYMRAIRMTGEGPVRVVVSHEEITALKLAEEALAERTQELEEANVALKVLLKHREQDKDDLERKVVANIRQMVLPYVEKLKDAPMKARERAHVEIIDSHLADIVSPFLQRLANAEVFLTPQELQVAAMVRDGKPSKEIADLLGVSDATVHFHRKNLRRKLGLNKGRGNLRSRLLAMS